MEIPPEMVEPPEAMANAAVRWRNKTRAVSPAPSSAPKPSPSYAAQNAFARAVDSDVFTTRVPSRRHQASKIYLVIWDLAHPPESRTVTAPRSGGRDVMDSFTLVNRVSQET